MMLKLHQQQQQQQQHNQQYNMTKSTSSATQLNKPESKTNKNLFTIQKTNQLNRIKDFKHLKTNQNKSLQNLTKLNGHDQNGSKTREYSCKSLD